MTSTTNHGHRPYWKRAHHDWKFWIGMCLMLAAIAMYVMSEDLSMVPRLYHSSAGVK